MKLGRGRYAVNGVLNRMTKEWKGQDSYQGGLRRGLRTFVMGRVGVKAKLALLFAVACATLLTQCETNDSRSFNTPFIDLKAPQKSLVDFHNKWTEIFSLIGT